MSTAASLQNTAIKPQLLSNSPQTGLLLYRKCACGSPKSALTGECEECKGKKRLQAKLSIDASNDPMEREADRVADQVLAAPVHSADSGAAPRIQRYTRQATGEAGIAPASVDRALASTGRPLEPALQQDMGQRFGYDFSQVRVHSGSVAEQSAREVNAHAYTVGHNIVFGAGRFAPESHQGRRLIAHELTHVVQQSVTEGIGAGDKRGLSPNPALQRTCAPCEASSMQSDEEKKPKHKGFTFEDLLAGELKQGEALLETTETEEGMPQKFSSTINVKPRKTENFQRPRVGSATIVCEGGDYVVKLNSWAGKPCGISNCVTVHESSHIVDWKARWPKGCKKADGTNQADGYLPLGGDGYDAFLKKSECTAHTKDLECAAEKLKGATGDCKTKLESYIKLTENQKKSFC